MRVLLTANYGTRERDLHFIESFEERELVITRMARMSRARFGKKVRKKNREAVIFAMSCQRNSLVFKVHNSSSQTRKRKRGTSQVCEARSSSNYSLDCYSKVTDGEAKK